jgi:hypothetical protein
MLLLGLLPDAWRFGGSNAQREIIEQTLLYALVEAGRTDSAQQLTKRVPDRQDGGWLVRPRT